MPQEILLGTQKILVDIEDYERIIKHKWYIEVGRVSGKINGKRLTLANFIMEEFNHKYAHKNRNKLDHRKENLRKCNNSQNAANREKWVKNGTSKYKGVNKHKDKWRARIKKIMKKFILAYFQMKGEAALAYNKKALELFGEFAVFNEV